jgi:hypothetical protein
LKHYPRHIICALLPLLLLLFTTVLMGQQSGTMYMMHSIPQSNLLNPAIQAKCGFIAGVPLGSAYFNYSNTAFTYNDLAATDTWNLYGVHRQMHRSDLYSVEAAVHPIYLGYRHHSWYFSFHVAEKIQVYQIVPGELVETLLYGNGPFVGSTARFNGLRGGGFYLREYSLAVARSFSPKWTFGMRGKILFGKAGIQTSRSRASLTTEETTFSLFLEGDFILNTSFPYTFRQDTEGNINGIVMGDPDYTGLLLNRRNPGFALDAGAIYRLDDRTTLAVSILDLGFLRWRSDVNNIRASGSFIYKGVPDDPEIVSNAFAAEFRDTVLRSFDLVESQLPYGSFLPPQFFLGGSWKPRERLTLGIVSSNEIYRSKLHSSVTFTAGTDVAERLLLAISWSWLNNSPANAGAVLAYHGKGIQFHVSTDNFLGFFFPFDTRSLNIRGGINLMLGCPRDRERQSGTETYEMSSPGGDCSWTGNQRKERQRQRRARKIQNTGIDPAK